MFKNFMGDKFTYTQEMKKRYFSSENIRKITHERCVCVCVGIYIFHPSLMVGKIFFFVQET